MPRQVHSCRPPVRILVDSREKLPYEFPESRVQGLQTGDYSIEGYEDLVAVERKSKSDAYTSLGRDRARFRREVERLAQMEYAALVIESDLRGFLSPPAFSRMNPDSALGTLLAWSVRYRIPIFFVGDRDQGRRVTFEILQKFRKHQGRRADA